MIKQNNRNKQAQGPMSSEIDMDSYTEMFLYLQALTSR